MGPFQVSGETTLSVIYYAKIWVKLNHVSCAFKNGTVYTVRGWDEALFQLNAYVIDGISEFQCLAHNTGSTEYAGLTFQFVTKPSPPKFANAKDLFVGLATVLGIFLY